MKNCHRTVQRKRQGLQLALFACLTLLLGALAPYVNCAAPPTIPLSDNPLVLVTPTHPQVLMLLNNSQSMDGNLSGAIMVGATGSYAVPAGFTPPLQAADGSGNAPYTVSGKDNSASRMNVAKTAIQAILNNYANDNDFGLMDLGTSGSPGLYTTWVYYMSAAGGGFTFTSTAGTNTYSNPCYQVSSSNCTALAGRYGSGVSTMPYMVAAGPSDGSSNSPGSSDDPKVNDVLYAGAGLPGVFVTYNGPSPATPYPPNYSLANYNAGSILESYKNSTPNVGAFGTSPTNAGFVPYSPEVLYAQRGFGYYNAITNTGTLLVPIAVNSSSRMTTFSNLLLPETSNAASGEIKSNAVNAATAGMLKSAYGYYTGSSPPPSNNGCAANKYVVLITDGLPTWDLAGKAWPPLGSASAAGYGVTATISNGVLTSTNNTAVNDALAQIAALKARNILTYVVGLGAGVDPNVNAAAAATLSAMAAAGGTGNYFAATSPADVVNDLQVILEQIQSANVSTTSAAVNSTNLRTNSMVYQSSFNSKDTPYNDWTGEILEFPIASNGTVNTNPAAALWAAQSQLDGLNWDTGRRIVTYNPTAGSGVPFRWSATPPAKAISTAQQTLLQPADTLGPDRLNYLRGNIAREQRNGGAFRNRSHVLGDIVDSNPLYVGSPSGPYRDVSYQSFQASNSGRAPMLYVGANDGMLHAFNANNGQEVYAYIPNGVFNRLINLTQTTYNTAHKFYVDGSPYAGDVQFSDGTWHTLLTGGLNNGGSSIYAVDITTPPTGSDSESTIATRILWEYTDTVLGKTYSRPVTARIPNGINATQFVVLFGSGYNNSDGNPYLYAVNAQTGTLVKKVNLCQGNASVCDASKANGLSSPAAVSTDGTGLVTLVYVGDLQGNLWKIDVSSSNWSVTPIFKALDATGNAQPITTIPAVSQHPNAPAKSGYMVYFGTGRFVGLPDVTDVSKQSFYGIWDDLSNTVPTRTNLVAQTVTTVTTTTLFNGETQARLVTANTIDWTSKRGWYMDLPASGERSITDPRLVGKRIAFTSFVPSSNSCTGGGQSWLMVVDYATGGALSAPEIDLNGDGQLNATDQINGQNPGGISLGTNYASSPTFLGGGGSGADNDVKLVSKSNGKIDSVKERGMARGRMSWTQLK